MRIRTIKPEFWKSEKVASLPVESQLLFIGLFNLSDDAGRFRAHPNLIQGELFPYRPGADVESWLQPLVAVGLVLLYEADGRRYGLVVGFAEHQKVDKRYPSRLPAPPAVRPPQPASPPAAPAAPPPPAQASPPVPPEQSAGPAEQPARPPDQSAPDQGMEGKGKEQAPDARMRAREGPTSTREPADPPPDAVIEIQRGLMFGGYRSEKKPHERVRQLLAKAIDLHAMGLTPADLGWLIELDREKADRPGALLAVWIDRRQWRDVLAEQRMKAGAAAAAARGAAANAAAADGITTAPQAAGDVVANVLRAAAPASGFAAGEVSPLMQGQTGGAP